ncbi:hypothetical protein [uncultured Microbulbifer sp.]|uniref:hypothetical protein n=1 Tax=uncultured Microbulbifer sp. TaxID=348147 RepID=UPI0026099EBC|nr:hypothetical protein [uncultured Microbulbifer sp.]
MLRITLVCSRYALNKRVSRKPCGTLEKHPPLPLADGKAATLEVPTPAAFGAVLRDAGTDPNAILIGGYADRPSFRLVSQKKLATAPDGLTRTKDNFTQSSWVLFDYDRPANMPAHLQYTTAGEWLAAMGRLIPGFSAAGKVVSPSTSGRILFDGKPAGPAGWHCWVQVQDPADVGRFRKALLERAQGTPYGFLRRWGGGKRKWSIFDPTALGSAERVIFIGAPEVHGKGLTVARPDIQVIDGGALDTRRV